MFVIRKKLKLNIPQGWHELPWIKGLYLFSHPTMTDTEIMALITGVSEDEIRAVNDRGVIGKLLDTFFWISNPPNHEHPEMPKVIHLDGQYYHVPFVVYNDKFDLGNTSVGAIEDMKASIKKAIDGIPEPTLLDHMQAYPELVAIYLQSLKGYDHFKAMQLVPHVKVLDFKTVYNIGNFFLLRLSGLNNGYQNESSRANTLRRKLQRVFWILIQRLVSTLPWIR
jgi:hypothetical protein